MVTSKVCRVSLGFVSVATMSVFVACSSGDDSSPTSDGGAGWDAASNADVAVAPEGSAGDESSSTVDVVSPPDAAEEGVGGDAGQALDAPIDVATSDGAQAEGAADAVADATNSIDSTMSGDDATTGDVTVGDVSVDGGPDATSSPEAASTPDGSSDDATSDVTTGDDAAAEASEEEASTDSAGTPDTAPVGDDAGDDGSTANDGSNDASDVAGPPLLAYTFNTDQQGWFVQSTSPAAPAALAAQSYAIYSGSFGNPPGSVFAYAAFSDSGQKVTVGITFAPPYEDFTGKTVSMDIFLAGGSQQFTYFYLFCQDDAWDWEDPGPQLFPPVVGGQWMHVTLNVSHPQGFKSTIFDTTQIRVLGVELDSGSGIGPGSITPVSVYIDNVIVQ
jgi:hypothetical protein